MHNIFENRIILFIIIGLLLLSFIICIIRCLCKSPIKKSTIYPNILYINPLQVKIDVL